MEEYMHDVAVAEIQRILQSDRFQGLSVVPSEGQTGTSFFHGKQRLCKVLKTKRGLRIEINVPLPKEIASLEALQEIEKETAYNKHYGTVRHIYRGDDLKEINMIMMAAVEEFRALLALGEIEQMLK